MPERLAWPPWTSKMLKQSKCGLVLRVTADDSQDQQQAEAPDRQPVPASYPFGQRPGSFPGLCGLAAAFSAPHSVCKKASVAGARIMHSCKKKQAGVAQGLKQAERTCSSNDRMMQQKHSQSVVYNVAVVICCCLITWCCCTIPQ